MAFDGILLSCVINELNRKVVGGRIDKVYQPEKDEIHVIIRCKGENQKLLISASSNHPRIHLTGVSKDNPLTPPMFCMLLRKHLVGSRIIDIKQPSFERIVEIYIEGKDELGDLTVKKLIVEIMGRHSNIILVDGNRKILDSIKHITQEISRIREVLPGKDYVLPPSQGKLNPLEQDLDSLLDFIESIETNRAPARVISENFTGISRGSAQEIVFRAVGDNSFGLSDMPYQQRVKIANSFIDFFEKVKAKQFTPVLLKDESGRPKDVFPFKYLSYSLIHQNEYDSVSEALEHFFTERDKLDRIKQRSSYLLKILRSNLERCQKKSIILQEELAQAKNADKYRLWGELITANLYQIQKGVREVNLTNYYDPNCSSVTIPMDEHKTASQNAQMYFKKYAKAKTAVKMVSKQLCAVNEEIQYLENQLENVEKCTEESEIQEIRDEMIREGYLKGYKTQRERNKGVAPSKPHHFISSDNFDIFVGKNNTQNDYLTLKIAGPEDIWLHTKNIPGSHVIIKTNGREVPEGTYLEAGILAAFFSKGKHSSNVPVDFCPRKNVKKPNGAKPGMVIYDKYNTMYVTPSEEEVNKLRKVQ